MATAQADTKDVLLAYARNHPEESASAVARRFDVPSRTVARWLKTAGLARTANRAKHGGKAPISKKKVEDKPTPPPKPSRARRSPKSPAEDMPIDDRIEAIDIVRRSRRIAKRYLDRLELALAAWEERMEEIEVSEMSAEDKLEAIRRNPMPKLDARETQAILNLQKAADTVITTHPGLLELGNAGHDKDQDRDQRRSRLRLALGIEDE